jgi:hypothetical protein
MHDDRFEQTAQQVDFTRGFKFSSRGLDERICRRTGGLVGRFSRSSSLADHSLALIFAVRSSIQLRASRSAK